MRFYFSLFCRKTYLFFWQRRQVREIIRKCVCARKSKNHKRSIVRDLTDFVFQQMRDILLPFFGFRAFRAVVSFVNKKVFDRKKENIRKHKHRSIHDGSVFALRQRSFKTDQRFIDVAAIFVDNITARIVAIQVAVLAATKPCVGFFPFWKDEFDWKRRMRRRNMRFFFR